MSKSVEYYFLVYKGRVILRFYNDEVNIFRNLEDKYLRWFLNGHMCYLQDKLKRIINKEFPPSYYGNYTWETVKNTIIFGEAICTFNVSQMEYDLGMDIIYADANYSGDEAFRKYPAEWREKDLIEAFNKIVGNVFEIILSPEFRPADFNFFGRFNLPKEMLDINSIKNINIVNDDVFYVDGREHEVITYKTSKKKLRDGTIADANIPHLSFQDTGRLQQ